jgi:DNA ligase D-like protein (predicted 3'-phosphoesterase)
MTLADYKKKRDFKATKEPKPSKRQSLVRRDIEHLFVVQKHFAMHLHYDFRLEINDVLKSWAIPKGLAKSTKEKRLGIQTDDHPLEYADFEGIIPEGHYGAGKVVIWDKGSYVNLKRDEKGKEVSLRASLRKGHLEVWLFGKRFKGAYAIVHFKKKNWLFVKMDEKKLKLKLAKFGQSLP